MGTLEPVRAPPAVLRAFSRVRATISGHSVGRAAAALQRVPHLRLAPFKERLVTTPGFPPAEPEPGTVTEPVPPPAPAVPDAPPVFSPAAPEGAPLSAPQPGSVTPAASSSRVLTGVLIGILVVAGLAISFAMGRASAPAAPETVAVGHTDNGAGNNGGNTSPNGNGRNGGNTSPNGNGPSNNGQQPGGRFGPNGNSNGNGTMPNFGNGAPGAGGFGGSDNRPGVNGFGRMFGGFGLGTTGTPQIQGTVESVTTDSITIKTASGLTVTMGLDSSTTYHQLAAATASDVKTGSTVQLGLSGGVRPGQASGGANGTITLGTAGTVTIVP
jgi:hypothetical protein